ncbi:MAG: PAS domain S-box protein, partial [Verrucomicrobiales bacterium]|nr:PAS domain S-box protein [Verrucomicrobiales bacterium]
MSATPLQRVLRVAGLLLLLAVPRPAPGQAPASIDSARQVLSLAPDDAERRIPCTLRGVVTCSSRRGDLLFVQDATAGVYVYHQDAYPSLGDRVEVVGFTGKGLFSPIVMADRITVLGRSELPAPLPVSVEELAFGRYDAQWVEVRGIVTRQSEDWGHLLLRLASGSARLEVRILDFDPKTIPSWVDAEVRIRGIAGTTYNQHRQLTGFHLLTPSTNFLHVVRPGAADPFAVPLRTGSNLMAYAPGGMTEHRMRLRGIVAWSWPDRGFYLRDPSGNVHVIPVEPGTLQPGDLVDAVGFAAPSLDRPVLRDAVFRVTGHTNAPSPRTAGAREAASGSAEGDLLTLEGIVHHAHERHEGHSSFIVESDGVAFRVRHRDEWSPPIYSDDLVESRIRISGICTRDPITSGGATHGFSIWLRGPEDISVLQESPKTRHRRAQWALGGMGALVLLGGAWTAALRHKVRSQTQAIRKREAALEERWLDLYENSNDIIYTHDLQGIVTSVNKAGLELLGMGDADIVGRNIETFVDPSDLPLVRRHIRSKLSGVPRTSYEIRLRTPAGQAFVLEVNSRLLHRDGIPVAVQGIARDITERKEAEEALRSSERQLRSSLEERDRIGRDLHDGIIQSIYAAGLALDDCSRILRPEPETAERRIRAVTSELNRVIREVRSFIGRLEQDPLSGAEFKTAVQALAAGGSPSVRIDASIDDDAARRLKPHQANHLLQIAREALANSLRHGQATRVAFSLAPGRAGIQFEIRDDGRGFDTGVPSPKGRGLRNIAARADR